MKASNILLSLVVMGTLNLGFAQDTVSVDVDVQIETIQSAPAEERVQLMNEFKQKLMQMNADERNAAIATLQTKMQNESSNMQNESSNMQNIQVRSQTMQSNYNEDMVRMQNMNQQQVGNQFSTQSSFNGGSTTSGTSGTDQYMMY
jgi:hypothetical protein